MGSSSGDPQEARKDETSDLFKEGYAFEGASVVALVEGEGEGQDGEDVVQAMAIVLEDGVMLTLELDSGEKRLVELGYTQTLQRDLTGFELFSLGFACIGPYVGIVPYYGTAFTNGGPVAVIWYWWIIGFASTFTIMSLAEIASSLPLAGSMYFWAAHLAPPSHRALAAWITGWLEFIGTALGSGADVLASVALIADIIKISTSVFIPGEPATDTTEATEGYWEAPWIPDAAVQFGLSAVLMLITGLICCCKIKRVGQFLAITSVFQILLAFAIMICIPAVAPTHQSASFVFTTYLDTWVGTTPTAGYAFILAMLLPQYAQYAGDASAHSAEETKRADVVTPLAMVGSQVVAVILGWGILIAMTFSIQSVDNVISDNTITGGTEGAFPQILYDAFYARYGSGTGASVFTGCIWLGFFCCSVGQTLISSRVAYALARDGGLPFSSLFARLDSRRVPVAATVLTCMVAIVSLIPNCFSETAYFAVSGMATVCWFASYVAPIYYRLISPEANFTPGPFYMAKYIGVPGGKFVHFMGLLYALYTVCVFLIPNTFPIEIDTFNYAPIGIAIFALFFLGWWVIDARKWFKGPIIKDDGAAVEDLQEKNLT